MLINPCLFLHLLYIVSLSLSVSTFQSQFFSLALNTFNSNSCLNILKLRPVDLGKLTLLSQSSGQQLAPPQVPGYSQLTPPPTPPFTVHMAEIDGQQVPLTPLPPPPLTVHMAEIDGRQVALTPPPPPPFQSKIFSPPPTLPSGYGYSYDTPEKNKRKKKPFKPTLPPIPEDYILLRVDEQNRTLKLAKEDQDEDQVHEDQVHVDRHADRVQPRRKETRGSISLIRRKILNTLRSFCSCY